MKRIVCRLGSELGYKFDRFLRTGIFLLPSSEEFYSLYPELSPIILAIEDSLAKLGGSCLIKYQNKAPKDAIWISPERNLRCYTADDVILLLKSSDRILRSSTTGPVQLELVEWKEDWDTKNEFRLFFVDGCLRVISQRDCSAVFPSLLKDRETIRESLFNFASRFNQNHASDYSIERWPENESDVSISQTEFTHPDFKMTDGPNFVVDVYFNSDTDITVIDCEPEALCNDFCLAECAEGLRTIPQGTLLLVEQEDDCRLSVFNQNCLPEEEPFLRELLER